jgi:hypothetical protein
LWSRDGVRDLVVFEWNSEYVRMMMTYAVYLRSTFRPRLRRDRTLSTSSLYYVVYDRRTTDMWRSTGPCLNTRHRRHLGAGKLVPAYTKMWCSRRAYVCEQCALFTTAWHVHRKYWIDGTGRVKTPNRLGNKGDLYSNTKTSGRL